MQAGELGILNVGAGDTKLSFDPAKPAERKRAAKVVADMLKRGYAILIQVGEKDGKPLYQRAEAFDPEACEYIIVGAPEEIAPELEAVPAKRRGRPRKAETAGKPIPMRVKAERTSAVGVARSAGG